MIERRFNGGREPVLRSLLSFIRETASDHPFDLSGFGILVPTRNVGRRLRTVLAGQAGREGRALLSPRIFTPGSLFPSLAGETEAASRAARIVAATQAIERLREETRVAAFGESPATQMNDRLQLARFFLETRSTLGEGALDVTAVAGDPRAGDRERWAALAQCEKIYRRELKRLDLEDPDDLAARIVRDPGAWFGGERFVVAGVPDFPPRVCRFLENLSATMPIDILVLAALEESDRFDSFGRPDGEVFRTAPVEVPAGALRVNRDVGEALSAVADRLERFPDSRSACVCGVGRPESATTLSFELKSRGMRAHDPAGVPFAASPAGRFLRGLAGICYGEEIDDGVSWFRDPFVARWMRETGSGREAGAEREEWIREADGIQEEVLPSGIAGFLEILAGRGKSAVFAKTLKLRRLAEKLDDPFDLFLQKGASPLLAEVRGSEGVEEFADRFHEIRETGWASDGMKREERISFFLWAVDEAMDFPVYPEKSDGGIDVLGWLELLWDERPWLQIPDLYDGSIPSVVGAHPLIPEGLREDLGLPGRRSRDARDAYILAALCRLREEDGRVDLHVPARDAEGRVVQPSRLLYFTELEDLPERVKQLTLDPPAPEAGASARKPRIVAASDGRVGRWMEELEQVSVTDFSSYIRCPFTFFLERVAGYEGVEPDRLEMDARRFGTGVHAVLQDLDEDGDLNWNRLDLVEKEAADRLERWFGRTFGKRPGLLLQLQYEALWRRVRAAARIRFEARAEGWAPVRVEWGFGDEVDLVLEGIRLRGKIDLLEERGEEIRIVDYKTSDKPTSPLDAHRKRLSGRGGFQPAELFPFPGEASAGWTNLQLPLYAAAVRKCYPGRPLRVAYGQLPRALGESRLEEWPEFGGEVIESALETAGRVIRLWRQKGFWPPVYANFRKSDAYGWSGPAGDAAWAQGELMDLSRWQEGGPEA